MVAFPAARIGDPVTHDLLSPCGLIGYPLSGPCPKGQVFIEGQPAAHVTCGVMCLGTTLAGPIPSPLHVMPAGPPASSAGGEATSESGPPQKPVEESKTNDFEIQVLSGSLYGLQIPLPTPAFVPNPGGAVEVFTFQVTDSDGNIAIYQYTGTGSTAGYGAALRARDFGKGDPVPFHTDQPHSVTDFEGMARLLHDEAGPHDSVVFKFGKPDEFELEWNDDYFREWFTTGPFAPIFRPKEFLVETESFDLKSDDVLPSRTAAMGNSRGMLELIKVIPKPEPPAVPQFVSVPSINPIVVGSSTVFVHGLPAARWVVSGDIAACLAMLGDPMRLVTRTVWMG